MTALAEPTVAAPPPDTASVPTQAGRGRVGRLVVMAGAVLFVLALTRVLTDTSELTRSATFGAALRLAVPIGLAGLGAIYAERAGVVNIGLEGMMILGTWFGGWAGWEFGPWWGVVLGIVGGALGGLLHAVATITFGVDHIVSGVAINTLAAGVARYLSVITFTPGTGGGASQSPAVHGSITEVSVPFLAGGDVLGWRSPDLFGWIERRRWFLVSDVGGFLRGMTGNLSVLTIIAVALVPLSFWVLWRTRFGLHLRSVGEHPVAAESLGVRVYTMKYVGVVVSGAMAGLAGAFLVLEFAGIYQEGQTGGRGFIGLATMIFGNWRPAGVAAGAGLFGFADALQLRSDASVHAMLLAVALGLGALSAWALARRRTGRAVVMGLAATLFLVWFAVTDSVPRQFVFFTPHVTTLLVLGLAHRRLRMPAADGVRYRKGEAL